MYSDRVVRVIVGGARSVDCNVERESNISFQNLQMKMLFNLLVCPLLCVCVCVCHYLIFSQFSVVV